MLTPEELAIARRGFARSIAAGRTTVAAPLSPAQYAALPEEPDHEPEPVNLLASFQLLVEKFHQKHPDPFTAGELDEWLYQQGIHSTRPTISTYLHRGIRDGWLVPAGNKPTGYKENLYQLHTSPASSTSHD
jgi:hypothetical protein